MLYIVFQVNTTDCFVHSRTILLASHRNGSTTPPVAKWPKIKPVGTLDGCRAIPTRLYDYIGVPNALYAFKRQYN